MPDAPVQQPPPGSAGTFYLWPENVEAWRLFLECRTEWRGSGMGREGLDKAGVERIMRYGWARVRPRKRMQRFRELQVMEAAALDEWAKRDAREAAKP